MRRLVVISVYFLVAMVAAASMYLEKVDDGFIISTKTHVIDPIGELKLAVTKATRNCSSVLKVDATALKTTLNVESIRSQFGNQSAQPRAGWREENWILAETDFDNAEPAIILLKRLPNGYELAAVYSGTAAPFNDVQVIHEYFMHQRPDAPKQLINCYEPVGGPFDRAS